jgi:hypothetical protein
MKFFSATVLVAGLTTMVAAVPQVIPRAAPTSTYAITRPTYAVPVCLNSNTANYLVKGFASLITNYKQSVADALLDASFTDTSDSSK